MTPACFGDGTYDEDATEKCLSNLLELQFRKFVIDLYWDTANSQFNLCPVAFPPTASNATTTAQAVPTVSSQPIFSTSLTGASIAARQSVNFTGTATAILDGSVTTGSTPMSAAPVATVTGTTGNPLLDFGSVRCSRSLTLSSVISLFSDYVGTTSNTIDARLQFLEFSLHVAAPYEDPSLIPSAPPTNQLPGFDELVGQRFSNSLNIYMYTPSALNTDRIDLNSSWFRAATRDHYPITQYFQTYINSQGNLATQNGWPNEVWLQVTQGRRLLLSWGQIAPQMQGYNFSADSGFVFAAGSLSADRQIGPDDIGRLASGCFYHENDFSVARPNSSWAVTSPSFRGLDDVGALVGNITSCGIAPMLNDTLGNTGAQNNFLPYQNFSFSAVWSWAADEPKNASNPQVDTDSVGSQFRCALLDPSDGYQGHWRVEDCRRQYRAACRVANEPYVWRLSTYEVPYGFGSEACDGNSTFAVPRTGLENTYLYHHVLDSARTKRDNNPLSGLWVNFNSLDVESCWVDTGLNGTCSYYEDEEAVQRRQVLIPVIGALIILILTVLTFFVKCNTNRKNSRTRRRGEGGWDYEGVPS